MTTWLAIWYPEKDHNIDYHPMMRNNQRDEIHMMSNWMSKWYGNTTIAETSYGITLMLIGLIALAALIVLAVWLISVVSSGSMLKVSSVKSAKELLDKRYAKGEISIPGRVLECPKEY